MYSYLIKPAECHFIAKTTNALGSSAVAVPASEKTVPNETKNPLIMRCK